MSAAIERPGLEVADIIRKHGEAFLERHGNVLSEAERRELDELAHEDRAETPESEPGE